MHGNRKVQKHRLTKEDMVLLIDHVLYEHGVNRKAVITFLEIDNYAHTTVDVERGYVWMNFPKKFRNAYYAIHECAHVLRIGPDHGARYNAQYFRLLSIYLGWDEEHLRDLAQKYGLKVGPKNLVKKKVRTGSQVLIA